MTMREQYIKPSLLRLDFSADMQAECDLSNCKTTGSSSGQCSGATEGPCSTSGPLGGACTTLGS